MASSQASKHTDTDFGNPADPWNMLGSEYDQSRFYTRSSDGNGHSALIHIKLSPSLHGQLTQMLEDKRLPAYRTQADVVRDALIHRMKWIQDNYDDVLNLAAVEQELRQAEVDSARVQRNAWKKYLADLDATLTEMIAEKELDEAEWLMDRNEWSDTMTPPYLAKLAAVLSKHRNEIARLTKL